MQLLLWIVTQDIDGSSWLYDMKTKDSMLKVIKKWYNHIADIREKHDLVVAMRDNAGENKSHEILEFIKSTGARNHFMSNGRMDLLKRRSIQL